MLHEHFPYVTRHLDAYVPVKSKGSPRRIDKKSFRNQGLGFLTIRSHFDHLLFCCEKTADDLALFRLQEFEFGFNAFSLSLIAARNCSHKLAKISGG